MSYIPLDMTLTDGVKLDDGQDFELYDNTGTNLVATLAGDSPVIVYSGASLIAFSGSAGREILIKADGNGDATDLYLASSSVAANTFAKIRINNTDILTIQAAIVELSKKLKIGGALGRPHVSKTANYTASIETDSVILCDATGGAFTITLPTAASADGYQFDIKKIDASANTVTVDGDGAETIDDSTTAVLTTQYESITVYSDGSEWWIL